MRPLRDVLPRVAQLLDDLDDAVRTGTITTTDEFTAESRRRWDASLLAHVDTVLPHWSTMASYADGKTLWHVTIAMVALLRLDDYLAAEEYEQHLLEWTVFLHDIAKEPTEELRDHRHAFRSAALAARYLPRLGFATTEAYASEFEAWFEVADNAYRADEAAGEPVQDNRFLAEILDGADRMLDLDGARLIKAIAMHQSVTVLEEWPSLAPLTPEEEQQFVTPQVASLQRPLMLADSGGWNLFDPPTLLAMYDETRRVFSRISASRS